MEESGNQAKYFEFLNPVLNSEYINNYDSYILGFCICKYGPQNISKICELLNEAAILRNLYNVPINKFKLFYHLILEANFDYVFFVIFLIMYKGYRIYKKF